MISKVSRNIILIAVLLIVVAAGLGIFLLASSSKDSESRTKPGKVILAKASTGTYENPVPLGQQKQVTKDFKVTVNSFDPRPDKEITKQLYNQVGEESKKYIVANVTITYSGDEFEIPYLGYDLCQTNHSVCFDIPEVHLLTKSALSYAEMAKGETRTGDIFFETDLQVKKKFYKLTLGIDDNDTDMVYFAVE